MYSHNMKFWNAQEITAKNSTVFVFTQTAKSPTCNGCYTDCQIRAQGECGLLRWLLCTELSVYEGRGG